MSNKFKFVLNREGVRQLLKSNEIVDVMEEHAKIGVNNVASLKDYDIDNYFGTNRANVSISAKTKKGEKDNLNNNILLKALGSSKR